MSARSDYPNRGTRPDPSDPYVPITRDDYDEAMDELDRLRAENAAMRRLMSAPIPSTSARTITEAVQGEHVWTKALSTSDTTWQCKRCGGFQYRHPEEQQ